MAHVAITFLRMGQIQGSYRVNAEKRRPAFSHAKWEKQRVGLRVGDEGKAYWRMRKNNRFRGPQLLEKEEECIAIWKNRPIKLQFRRSIIACSL